MPSGTFFVYGLFLDKHVCLHIYENVLMGLIRDATKILVTHQLSFLRDARIVVMLGNGKIEKVGTPKDILQLSPDGVPDLEGEPSSEEIPVGADVGESEKSPSSKMSSGDHKNIELAAEEDKYNLIEPEERMSGAVAFNVYHYYVKTTGYILSFVILISLFLMQGSKTLTDWYLVYWIHNDQAHNSSLAPFYEAHADLYENELGGWTPMMIGLTFLEVFIILGGFNSFLTLVRSFSFAKGGLVAAFNMHEKLLTSVLNVRPAWFDKNPPGRILNRFSSDINEADDSLPFILNIYLNDLVRLLGTLVIISYSLPWFLLVVVPLIPFYASLQTYYRDSARDLKRLAGISLSPIYQHFR